MIRCTVCSDSNVLRGAFRGFEGGKSETEQARRAVACGNLCAYGFRGPGNRKRQCAATCGANRPGACAAFHSA
jgi:hypothetical protein